MIEYKIWFNYNLTYISNLKKYAFIKIISVGLLVTWGFLQPSLFSKYLDQSDFAFLTLAYGYAVFLEFFDFGTGKPLYTILREKYIKQDRYQDTLQRGMILLAIILFYSLLLFTAVLFFKIPSNSILHPITVIALSISITLTIFLNHLRNLLFAIDAYLSYEYIDIARKLGNLISVFLIVIDNTFFLTATASALFMIILMLIGIYIIQKKSGLIWKFDRSLFITFLEFLKKIVKTAIRSFVYTFNLSLMYHIGFLVLPIYLTHADFIQFGLWYKIAYGCIMITGAISDISINYTTKCYYQGNMRKAYSGLFKTIIIAMSMLLAIYFIIVISKNIIFEVWVGKEYTFNNLIMLSLLFHIVGRGLQHIAAQLLLATATDSFKIAKNISLYSVFLTTIAALLAYLFQIEMQYFLIITNLIVLLDAFWYLKAIHQKLKN